MMANPISDPKLKLRFIDILGEVYRTYVFPGYDEVTIEGGVYMAEASDRSHRVLTKSGKAYHVNAGWLYLFWEVEDGIPYFRW